VKKEDHLRKASGYIGLSMHEDALAEIESALALDRGDAGLFFLKGECLRELGRFADAVPAYGQSLDLGGSVLGNSVGLGWCLKRMGRLDDSIDVLQRAIESEGEVPLLCYNLACYFSLQARADAAIGLLERAVQLDPSFLSLVGEESDFDNVRNDPRFISLAKPTTGSP
jgi:tetratricopeptide (TPR) repeat protein